MTSLLKQFFFFSLFLRDEEAQLFFLLEMILSENKYEKHSNEEIDRQNTDLFLFIIFEHPFAF